MKFLLLLVASFLLLTSSLFACEPDAGAFDWARCHSLLRYGVFGVSCLVWWFFCFNIYFPAYYESFFNKKSKSFILMNSFFIILVFSLLIGFLFVGMSGGWEKVTYLKGVGDLKSKEVIQSVVLAEFDWSVLIVLMLILFLIINVPLLSAKKDKPLASHVFYYSAFLLCFLVFASYLILFAGFGAELRYSKRSFFDNNWSWLNLHWRWLFMIFGFFIASVFFYLVLKSQKRISG